MLRKLSNSFQSAKKAISNRLDPIDKSLYDPNVKQIFIQAKNYLNSLQQIKGSIFKLSSGLIDANVNLKEFKSKINLFSSFQSDLFNLPEQTNTEIKLKGLSKNIFTLQQNANRLYDNVAKFRKDTKQKYDVKVRELGKLRKNDTNGLNKIEIEKAQEHLGLLKIEIELNYAEQVKPSFDDFVKVVNEVLNI